MISIWWGYTNQTNFRNNPFFHFVQFHMSLLSPENGYKKGRPPKIKDEMSFGIYTIQLYVQSSLPLLRRFLLVSLCSISILKRMDFFKTVMKCYYILKTYVFFLSILKQQPPHFLFHLFRRCRIPFPSHIWTLFIFSNMKPLQTTVWCVCL